MAFFSDLDKKITQLSQEAIQKTKEVTDTAKLSSAIKGLEQQKKECLEQLGRFYYNAYLQYGGKVVEEAAGIIEKIEDIERQQKKLQEDMNRIKGTICCPNCNTAIPENSRFCNVCGAKIEQPQKTENVQTTGKVCRQCGASMEKDQIFCTNCGTKAETEGAGQEDHPEKETERVSVCPNCGKEQDEGQRFCTSCGTKVG